MNDTAKTLMTVLDKALQETEPDPSPQSTAYIAARNQNARDRYSQKARTSYPAKTRPPVIRNPGLVASQITLSGPPLWNEEELNTLRNAQHRMVQILSEMEQFSTTAADRAHDSQSEQTFRAVMAGEKTPPHRSRASFHAEYRAEQNARMELLRRITHDTAGPIVRAILQRFTERADSLLREIEEGDQFLCASYGLEYEPSVIWQAVAHISGQYLPETRLPLPSMYAMPRNMLEGIVDL